MAPRFLVALLPRSFVGIDNVLTFTATRLLTRVAIACISLAAGGAAVVLLNARSWRDVLAGAFLAWSVSGFVWAVGSYHAGQQEVRSNLRRTAEIELLHARLNHIAAKVGAPLLNLNDDSRNDTVAFRIERHAHLSRLEELGGSYDSEGRFWDNAACGDH